MSEKNDGGPAFPDIVTDFDYYPESQQRYSNTYSTGGMSLRDYFAAAALQGMLTQGFIPSQVTRNRDEWSYTAAAYRLADEMLKARGE